ncbi:MAG: hypothetical protein KDG50_03135 [Chromatiales bacterium]|nr:hypothetical protein [Chromatiales bacterium]
MKGFFYLLIISALVIIIATLYKPNPPINVCHIERNNLPVKRLIDIQSELSKKLGEIGFQLTGTAPPDNQGDQFGHRTFRNKEILIVTTFDPAYSKIFIDCYSDVVGGRLENRKLIEAIESIVDRFVNSN